VLAEVEDDLASVAFYSCYPKDLAAKNITNPAAHPQSCIYAFQAANGF